MEKDTEKEQPEGMVELSDDELENVVGGVAAGCSDVAGGCKCRRHWFPTGTTI